MIYLYHNKGHTNYFFKKTAILFADYYTNSIFAAVTREQNENIHSKYILVVALRTTQKFVRDEAYMYIPE